MKVALHSKSQGSQEYNILLILTDGEIHDMEQSINALIKSAYLPLSVIIVGLGKSDFTNMVILDGDDGLFNSDGVKAERDLVQFVPFRDFQSSAELLAKHVLEEIPDQLVEYMTSVKVMPKPPQYIDTNILLRGDTLNEALTNRNPPPSNNNVGSYNQIGQRAPLYQVNHFSSQDDIAHEDIIKPIKAGVSQNFNDVNARNYGFRQPTNSRNESLK